MNTVKKYMRFEKIQPTAKLILVMLLGLCLSACNALIGGSGNPGGAGGISLPLPSGGGESSESSDMPPLPSTPASPQSSGANDGEPSSDQSQRGESPEAKSSDNTSEQTPQGWENDTDAPASSAHQDNQPSFEESNDADEAFEAPDFEDIGGLSEQELAELEKELDETLGDFDEEIKREQEYAEASANDNLADSEDGEYGEFENYNEEAETLNKTQSRSQQSGRQSSSSSNASQRGGGETVLSNRTEKNASKQEQVIKAGAKSDVDLKELAKNDDIVARQIREAAENEVDPELQKKLWEEYHHYKQQ